MKLVVALCLGGALAAARVREARACLPPPDGVWGRSTLPGDGAVDVPLNARVQVLYDTSAGVPGSTLVLRPQGGEPVAFTETTPYTRGAARLLTPDAPLAPSTTYEVLDTLAVPCEAYDVSQCLGDPVVIATFTTGTALDTTAPRLVGVAVESQVSCLSESCPDGEDEQIDVITVTDAVDDHPWVQYEYLSVGGEVLAGPTSWRILGRGCGGGAGYFPLIDYLAVPAGTIEMRAVDLAGNVEAPRHTFTTGSCALVDCDPDAGVGGDPDARDGGGSGGSAAGEPGGCGCASGGGGGSGGALALLALARLRRRR